jgi:hypothetical protein
MDLLECISGPIKELRLHHRASEGLQKHGTAAFDMLIASAELL